MNILGTYIADFKVSPAQPPERLLFGGDVGVLAELSPRSDSSLGLREKLNRFPFFEALDSENLLGFVSSSNLKSMSSRYGLLRVEDANEKSIQRKTVLAFSSLLSWTPNQNKQFKLKIS